MARDHDDLEFGDDLELGDDFNVDELASKLGWLGGERKPPLPHRWTKLIDDVSRELSANQGDPNHPLHQIGRFEGLLPRGRGGFGLVFEVRDPELDRHVALKLCLTRGPEAAEAIIREAKLLAKLSHPNVVTVHETGRYGDDVFFVMEYVEGFTAPRTFQRGSAMA